MSSSSETMRAILCPKPGGELSTVVAIEAPKPQVSAGEVLVRVNAVSLNPVDWKLCIGVAPWWDCPHIVGLDAAGVVEEVGEGVTHVAIGQRVAWHHDLGRPNGVFAEYVTAPAHVLAAIPESVTDEAAAALPCAGLTAFQALARKVRLADGDVILVQGASGGTGGFAVQIAKALGATVIGLARPKSFERVRALGADYVLDYTAPDLHSQVRAIAPDGVDVMFEVVKAKDANENFSHVRFNGQYATTDPLPDLSNVEPYTYALSVHEIALGGAYGAGDLRTQADFATMLGEMLEMVERGELDPMIEIQVDFEEIPKYLGLLRDRKVEGKIVATIGGKT
ncbi:alcohol dehydrogenase catalytic domain-containing protein [Lentibacter sp. XHP0401]|uniref:alcohol dehydrogenase catalytic domain-containing protein n=1 Tax=Lentibacter sp. XHP0401 TaxID=2984334 RepID=UPI0021E8C92E|nr:zinc-binding dehydrogenase [Lentibacter sp. XHP0401]MCV2894654.1 zinc-binding dehydrogenase [Lentibacter sp. XHP0401]